MDATKIIGLLFGSAFAFLPTLVSNSASRRRHNSHFALLSIFDEIHANKRKHLSYTPTPANSNPFIRIQKRGRRYDIQTAVTTFRKTPISKDTPTTEHIFSLDLHAQIHFADASYYQYYNDEAAFGSKYDRILYELILDQNLLSQFSFNNNSISFSHLRQHHPPKNRNILSPTQSDRNTASQYGLTCQVESINYYQEGWIHADLTREEFVQLINEGQSPQCHPSQQGHTSRPLWALASTSTTYPGAEFLAALFRPFNPNNPSATEALSRRLFTHLFLPGDALSGWIRAILWLGVPSPEMSIILVDWSSLSHDLHQRRNTFRIDGNIAPISPVAVPLLVSLLTGSWGTARRLVFGQVLVAGQSNEDTSKNLVLIEKRNERAMEVLRSSMQNVHQCRDEAAEKKHNRIALLYGAAHCHDLYRRLTEEEGFVPIATEWRTAFQVKSPEWGTHSFDEKNMTASSLDSVAISLVILPFYLLIGGFDWMSTVQELGDALDRQLYLDGFASVTIYLIRHIALYVALSKFVIDWGNNGGVSGGDGV